MMAEFIFFWKDVSFSIFFHFFLIEESYAGNDKVHFIKQNTYTSLLETR